MAIVSPSTTTDHSARNTPIQEMPLGRIKLWKEQPRKHFADDEIEELARSIVAHGLLEPIAVRPAPDGSGYYLLVIGERRYRAHKHAGLETILVRVLPAMEDDEALELALVENLQRRDLSPVEEARGYQKLREMRRWTEDQIAAAVKRSQSSIANALRLLRLPESVLARVEVGELSAAHARALVKYAAYPAVVEAIAEDIVQGGLTSKQVERGFDYEGIRRYNTHVSLLIASVNEISAEEARRHGLTVWGSGGYAVTPDRELLPQVIEAVKAERKQEVAQQLEAARAAAAAPVPAPPEAPADDVPANVPAVEQAAPADEPPPIPGRDPDTKNGRRRLAKDAEKAARLGLPRLDDLPHGSYVIVEPARWPKACGPNCECRGKALTAKGAIVDISTRPQHVAALRGQEERRRKREKSETAAQKRDRLAQALAQAAAHDPRALAIVVTRLHSVIGAFDDQRIDDTTLRTDLGNHLGPSAPRRGYTFGGDEEAWEVLAAHGPETLSRIIIQTVLLSEAERAISASTTRMPAVDWYLSGISDPSVAGETPEAEADETLPPEASTDLESFRRALSLIEDDDAPMGERVAAARILRRHAGSNPPEETAAMVDDLLVDDEPPAGLDSLHAAEEIVLSNRPLPERVQAAWALSVYEGIVDAQAREEARRLLAAGREQVREMLAGEVERVEEILAERVADEPARLEPENGEAAAGDGPRSVLTGLLVKYGVFREGDHPANDQVLLEFAEDLHDVPAMTADDMHAAAAAIAQIRAEMATVGESAEVAR